MPTYQVTVEEIPNRPKFASSVRDVMEWDQKTALAMCKVATPCVLATNLPDWWKQDLTERLDLAGVKYTVQEFLSKEEIAQREHNNALSHAVKWYKKLPDAHRNMVDALVCAYYVKARTKAKLKRKDWASVISEPQHEQASNRP